ncbi:MAG: hypothetical protein J6I49_07780 [Bacteroidales bacterium]|nr:hypothetical protein [Bacteroidales bacterium]
MKKTFKMLALVAMSAGLLFAACGKDDDDKNDNPTGGGSGGGSGTETAEWVDLGLPSGLLWAKWNLGATSPEEPGDYYAWGETATKSVYNWSTYKYCTVDAEGGLETLTKYNTDSDYGTTDGQTTLQASDDVATAKLGNGARIPTRAEWEELINNTTAEWTTMNGVNGRKFTAANGNSLFLPAAGYRWDSGLYDAGEYGYYWSSSLYADSPGDAWGFYFYSGGQDMSDYGRGDGQSVRAVRQN